MKTHGDPGNEASVVEALDTKRTDDTLALPIPGTGPGAFWGWLLYYPEGPDSVVRKLPVLPAMFVLVFGS